MNSQNYSDQIYNGIVSHYNESKHYGFIEGEDNNSYYFFVDTKALKQKNIELRKQNQTKKYRLKFCAGDEIQFKIRTINDKSEAYDIEYIRNVKRELLVAESEEKQVLSGYLKQIDGNKFFVKHISTYIFIPIKISNNEIDIDSVYAQRLNQLVQFKLEHQNKIEKLSAILVDREFGEDWRKVKEAYNTQKIIRGHIKSRTKGGMIVDIFGIDAFLPGSQIDANPIRDYDVFVDKTMEFKIIKIYENSNNIVVSHKSIIESQIEKQKNHILPNLEKGRVLDGIVKNITDYGAFIDLGGVDGLIHISDLSWEKVSHPKDIVTLGKKIKVMILNFDEEKKRIALGLKQLTSNNAR
ncbi:hypothetical protein FACS189452_08280 [Bacteroidia bacterium]|nr:hypothetical protein FACS189452_08280 [Bacteroidia bacterium]GHT80053.1 hypothetical protein FACS189467_1130 [Bacteroidia bacterium]